METIEASRLLATLEDMDEMLKVSAPTMRKWSRMTGFPIMRKGGLGLTW